jgi:hypothetical protein
MFSTQWPLPFYGNAMTLKHVKCGKGEKVCVLSTISWVEVFVYEKVFQNKLNVDRCEIKVMDQTHCILLTIVQRLYTH